MKIIGFMLIVLSIFLQSTVFAKCRVPLTKLGGGWPRQQVAGATRRHETHISSIHDCNRSAIQNLISD